MTETLQTNPKEIVQKYLLQGPFKAREITKEETEKQSKQLKDETWKAGEELMNQIINKFYYNLNDEHRYGLPKPKFKYFIGILAETTRTFRITFYLAECGYYRLAFANLRDILEFVMKIKYFYENKTEFDEWIAKPNSSFFTTSDLREKMFRDNKALNKEVENFSNTLSKNRHSLRFTLDSLGVIITDTSYYRKDLFEKWCKHMIMLKNLSIKIINAGNKE